LEKCDDQNTVQNDGCYSNLIEFGYSCNTASCKSLCEPTCGDGFLTGNEKCDTQLDLDCLETNDCVSETCSVDATCTTECTTTCGTNADCLKYCNTVKCKAHCMSLACKKGCREAGCADDCSVEASSFDSLKT